MKLMFLLAFSLLSIGCSRSNVYNDEDMYNAASKFKDLAQTVDGDIKFGSGESRDGNEVLEAIAKDFPNKILPFKGYDIKVNVQGDNAILLLCDGDVALIEDAGCNAVLDNIYWKNAKPNSCDFTIDSNLICN